MRSTTRVIAAAAALLAASSLAACGSSSSSLPSTTTAAAPTTPTTLFPPSTVPASTTPVTRPVNSSTRPPSTRPIVPTTQPATTMAPPTQRSAPSTTHPPAIPPTAPSTTHPATTIAPTVPTTAPAEKWKGRTILIGAVLTVTGPTAAYGIDQARGLALAAKLINATGGINGAKIRVAVKDDGGSPVTAEAMMRMLITKNKVLAVVGPTFSNAASMADPVADQLKTLVLAISNTGPGIVGSCAYPCSWVFRASLGEQTAIPVNVASSLSRSPALSAAVLSTSADPFAQTSGMIAAAAFRSSGVSVDGPIAIPAAPLAALRSAVKAAIASKPDRVFLTSSSYLADASMIKALRSAGYKGQILGGNAFNSAATSLAASSAGKGAQSAAAWFRRSPTPANRSFVAAYVKEYKAQPDQFAAQAFSGLELLAQAARPAPLSFSFLAQDRAAMKSSLTTVSLVTPLGLFSFTKDHDVLQPVWVVAMDGKGGFTLVKLVTPAKAAAIAKRVPVVKQLSGSTTTSAP